VIDEALDWLLAADPVASTWLGDHRFDGELPDLSDDGSRRIRTEAEHVRPDDATDPAQHVDVSIVQGRIDALVFERNELARQRWDPMVWNPGTALHLLISRGFDENQRTALQSRLRTIPDHLASARATLGEMSQIHLDTAVEQLTGTAELIDSEVRQHVRDDDVVEAAHRTVQEFITWLRGRRERAHRSPRLGERRYAEVLWHSLDERTSAAQMLESAEQHLDEVTTRLREVAGAFLGESGRNTVPRAFAAIAERWPVRAETIRPLVQAAMQESRGFVAEHDLVAVPDIDVRVIEMPAIHQGVAVAYCDAPGPLETRALPTFVAVAPPPASWNSTLIDSFFREYNGIAVHDLTIHEAFPGHVLQLAHAQRVPQRARKFGMSGVFVEGWAVYAEELMAQWGYAPNGSNLALQLQQLKFQARMTINAILDVRIHAMDMTEAEALSLMTYRGFQEEGEALGKWRRALLTAGQLPTYFVGYQAIRELAADVRILRPNWSDRQVHDAMLSQGSIAPRHVRTLLGA
jgi:uncharacterized protein (DUF885 family)